MVMKREFLLILCLLFFIWSCAGTTGYQAPAPSVKPAVTVEEEAVEPADVSCSYFYYLWGKSAEYDQRYDEAREAYEKALVCDPEADPIANDLAILLVRMDRKQEAAEWLKKISAKKPEDIGTKLLLAKIYSSMGDIDSAAATYNDILEKKEDPQTLLQLGSLYGQDRQYEKAQVALTRLVKLDPNSYLGHYYLARLYRELKFVSKAEKSYQNALNISWSNRLALEMADFFEQQDLPEKAVALYHRILEEDETNELARARLVNLFLSREEPERALEELNELRGYASDIQKVDITITRVLLAQKKYDEAIAILSSILETDPDSDLARMLLAIAHNENGNPDEAIELLRVIPSTAEEYEEASLLLIRILQEEKRTAEAIAIFEKRIENDDTSRLRFHVALAFLYKEQEQLNKARAVLDIAEVKFKDNVEIYLEYALFLERIGEQDDAIVKMEKVLELDPENSAALNYIGYTWADKGIRLDEALQYIQKAVDARPDDGFIRDSLGWVYFKLGDIERAEKELEKAIELVESDAVIFEHMGDVYLKLNKPQKALEVYNKSLEIYEEEDKKEIVRQKIKSIPQ